MIINHSGIALLSCPRRYQLRVLHRIKEPHVPALALGSAVHSAIEQYHLKDRNLANFNVMREADTACAKYNVGISDRPKVAGAIQSVLQHINRPLYNGDKPLVELKMNEPLEGGMVFQGTIDSIELSHGKDKLIVRDYKTTGYTTIAPVLEKYRFSIQVQYYMYGLRKYIDKYIPEDYRHLPLYGMYTIIPYNKSPVMVQHTSLVPPDDQAVADLIEKAAFLMESTRLDHEAGTLAAPIGRTAGECKSCRFNHICFAKNVDLAIEQAEKEDYNPMTFR